MKNTNKKGAKGAKQGPSKFLADNTEENLDQLVGEQSINKAGAIPLPTVSKKVKAVIPSNALQNAKLGAYQTMRLARMNKRHNGKREKLAAEKKK